MGLSSAEDAIVLLLGDSMVSGQGVHKYLDMHSPDDIGNPATFDGVVYEFGGSPGDICWRENEGTGSFWVADSLGLPFVNLACAAAQSSGILRQWEYAKARYGTNLDNDSTILISFGANDGLALRGIDGGGLAQYLNRETLSLCLLSSLIPFLSVETESLTDWVELETRIENVIATIAAEAPSSATIRVVGFPLQFRPFFQTVCWSVAAPCARLFDAVQSRLNVVLSQVTARVADTTRPEMKFVNIDDQELLPYAACSLTNKHIRDLTLDLRDGLSSFSVSAATFHPQLEAHMAIAGRILESLP